MIIQNQPNTVSTKMKQRQTSENPHQFRLEKSGLLKWNRVCSYCGAADLIPTGSCHVCRNCGAGNGCG